MELPNDILDMIMDHLPTSAIIALRCTNKFLYNYITENAEQIMKNKPPYFSRLWPSNPNKTRDFRVVFDIMTIPTNTFRHLLWLNGHENGEQSQTVISPISIYGLYTHNDFEFCKLFPKNRLVNFDEFIDDLHYFSFDIPAITPRVYRMSISTRDYNYQNITTLHLNNCDVPDISLLRQLRCLILEECNTLTSLNTCAIRDLVVEKCSKLTIIHANNHLVKVNITENPALKKITGLYILDQFVITSAHYVSAPYKFCEKVYLGWTEMISGDCCIEFVKKTKIIQFTKVKLCTELLKCIYEQGVIDLLFIDCEFNNCKTSDMSYLCNIQRLTYNGLYTDYCVAFPRVDWFIYRSPKYDYSLNLKNMALGRIISLVTGGTIREVNLPDYVEEMYIIADTGCNLDLSNLRRYGNIICGFYSIKSAD